MRVEEDEKPGSKQADSPEGMFWNTAGDREPSGLDAVGIGDSDALLPLGCCEGVVVYMTACGGTLGASCVWLATLTTSKTCWSAAEGRWFGFRPPRFAATYSQGRPRLAQRAQMGLSPEHFNFEKAHE